MAKKPIKKLNKTGNSLCVVMSREHLDMLGWDRETQIQAEVKDGKYIVSRKYQPFFKKGSIEKAPANGTSD